MYLELVRVGFDGEQVAEDLALMIAVHRAVSRRVEHLLALPWRHVAQHAKRAAHLLLARGVHVAELLRRVAHCLTTVRTQAFHILDAAEGALPLLRWHGVELMQTIDEPLLLRLRQAVESRLAAQRVFLADEGLALMAFKPIAEMRAADISRRRGVGSTRRRIGTRPVDRVRRAGRDGCSDVGTGRITGRSSPVCRRTIGRSAVRRRRSLHVRSGCMRRSDVRCRHVRCGHVRRGCLRRRRRMRTTSAMVGMLSEGER
jgi:hypothetical protein